MFKVEWLDRN